MILRRLVAQLILALELARDRCFQLRNAVNGRVFRRLTVADRLDGRLFDVVGRVEVRLAGAKPNDVAAGGFERARFVRHRYGGRRLDARSPVGEKSHCSSPIQRRFPKATGPHRQG